MLEALVIAGIVAAPLGSAALFLPPAPARSADRAGNAASAWQAARRFLLAVAGTAVLALAAGSVLLLIHATRGNLTAGVAGLVAVSAAYLAFTIEWTFASGLGAAGTAGGVADGGSRSVPAAMAAAGRGRATH